MADVSTDRGQLFIVTALTLGVLFVTLAMLLNTAIFAENLATRSTDPGVKEGIDFRETIDKQGGVLIEYVNLHNRTTYTTIGDGFDQSVSGLSGTTINQSLHGGRAAAVSNVSVTFGGQIVQTNQSRNFTDAAGTQDWQLASDVDNVRTFNMTVMNESLVDTSFDTGDDVGDLTNTSSPFTLTASLLTDTWDLAAINDTTTATWGGVTIVVTSGGTTSSCGPYNHSAAVDLVAGTVNGTCSIPAYPGSVGDGYDLSIDNGHNAVGAYRATLLQDEATLETGVYADESLGESPYATVLIWNATLNVTYTGPDLYYGTEVTTAPGDDDA